MADRRPRTPAKDSLATLGKAFGEQVSILQQAAALLCADLSSHAQGLEELEASVQALEDSLAQVQAVMARERSCFPQAKALAEALTQQAGHLDFISDNLPVFLPSAAPQQHVPAAVCAELDKENDHSHDAAQPPALAGNAALLPPKRLRPPPPRRYITVQELEGLPSYMRSRLTLDKVNAAIDDIAALAEANARLVAAARGRGHGLTVEERRHAQTLLRSVVGHDGVKGNYWMLDRDCKNGTTLKMDKTGKSILTLLRHLGRLHELRCQLDDDRFENVYILL